MVNLEYSLERLDEQRRGALETRAAFAYYSLCEKLGIQPEDQLLYEQGYLESNRKRPEPIKPEPAKFNIKGFLNESKCINIRDYFFDVSGKKKLLVKYFPRRFSAGCKQDLNKYKGGQIGKIFESIVNYYSKSK